LAKLLPPQWSLLPMQACSIRAGGKVTDLTARAWAAGETAEVVRATIQLLLLGEPGQHGTGCIPKSALLEVVPARGTAELADIIRIRHVSGDVSTISLKAYSQRRERFQGATIDYPWLDEERNAEHGFSLL
jgi:hypothetical protein